MKLKNILFPILAAVSLTGCHDKKDEPGYDEKNLSGDIQISLSQDAVSFDKNGGTVTIQIASNIKLHIDPTKGPSEDKPINADPRLVVSDLFTDTGAPIKYEYTLANNVLTINVDKTKRHFAQTAYVYLFDLTDTVRGKVKITLDGDTSIPVKLTDAGESAISSSFANFVKGLSWMYYVERGYTGMSQFNDVKCPMVTNDSYNRQAYISAMSSVYLNANKIQFCSDINNNNAGAVPFFTILNAITYTEMVDKWGNIGITELTINELKIPRQETPETVLRYLENSLDKISSSFNEKNGLSGTDANDLFDIPKDIWRIAKANVYMALNQHSNAKPYLQEIVDSHRYTLSSGNEQDINSGTILYFTIPDQVVRGQSVNYYSYADVLLLLAECNVATGNTEKATSLINQVAKVKNISVSGNCIADIENLRKQLLLPGYFAFQKRNNLGKYASYQKLWPIPEGQNELSAGWLQNPGY